MLARALRLGLEFVHQCISHPLLFFTGEARWVVRFHDWSEPHPMYRVNTEPQGETNAKL